MNLSKIIYCRKIMKK